jgi:hypothetical protein
MKRGFAFVAVVAIGIVGWTSGAAGQQQQAVSVSETTPMTVGEGCFTEPTTSPGSVTFARTFSEGALTITYHISGGPTDLNSDEVAGADHSVGFADGERTVTVVVHPAINATAATVTVVEGEGYVVGDPASGTIQVERFVPICGDPPSSTTTANTLARTGVRSTTGPLALVGITSVALGSLLLVLSSRRKMSGVR